MNFQYFYAQHILAERELDDAIEEFELTPDNNEGVEYWLSEFSEKLVYYVHFLKEAEEKYSDANDCFYACQTTFDNASVAWENSQKSTRESTFVKLVAARAEYFSAMGRRREQGFELEVAREDLRNLKIYICEELDAVYGDTCMGDNEKYKSVLNAVNIAKTAEEKSFAARKELNEFWISQKPGQFPPATTIAATTMDSSAEKSRSITMDLDRNIFQEHEASDSTQDVEEVQSDAMKDSEQDVASLQALVADLRICVDDSVCEAGDPGKNVEIVKNNAVKAVTINQGADVMRFFSNVQDKLAYAQHEFDEAIDSMNALCKAKAAWVHAEKARAKELAAAIDQAKLEKEVAEVAVDALRPMDKGFFEAGKVRECDPQAEQEQEANWREAEQAFISHLCKLHWARVAFNEANAILNSKIMASHWQFDADINVCLQRALKAASEVNAAVAEGESQACLMDIGPVFDTDAHGRPMLPFIQQPAKVQGPSDMIDSDHDTPFIGLSPGPGGDQLVARQANDSGVAAMEDGDLTGMLQDEAHELQAGLSGVAPDSAHSLYH